MTTVNSLSGGRTSSFMAVEYPADYNVFSVVCIDDPSCSPTDPAVMEYARRKLSVFDKEFGAFVATAEDDRTLKAMMDLEQLIGRSITWVRGVSFDELIDVGDLLGRGTKTRLPSWARRYCTTSMKLLPIFLWWWRHIGVKCEMRIGFRFDEFERMEKFFNYAAPTIFSIPVSCATTGQHRQKWEDITWRTCRFPLIRDGIKKVDVDSYWSVPNGRPDLFGSNMIEFPAISNCVGCFHKKVPTLAAMADLHPEKFRWFAHQETKGKGTWLDTKQLYSEILQHRASLGAEVIAEARLNYATCDTGGCTD